MKQANKKRLIVAVFVVIILAAVSFLVIMPRLNKTKAPAGNLIETVDLETNRPVSGNNEQAPPEITTNTTDTGTSNAANLEKKESEENTYINPDSSSPAVAPESNNTTDYSKINEGNFDDR